MRSPNEDEIIEWLNWAMQDTLCYVDEWPLKTREVKRDGNSLEVVFDNIPHKKFRFVYKGEVKIESN